ncbi:SAM-dependent methyltransferase [Roseiconus nitratireducens]|uniref:SAM-dependent methyltransferase n=1 Tax=Roseiconus nitratireducens TaxID=2605748 RepID=A0A5M6DFM8_9BACT|nr:SAM-dependent methyltransferase [Roseiconus nitratireducens]KAA5546203.1 SAM-dependent methyltransferase [Roseiconus nitratireducens]
MSGESEAISAIRYALADQTVRPDCLEAFAAALLRHHRSALRCRDGVDPTEWPFPVQAIPWYSLGFKNLDPGRRPSRMLDYAAGDFFLQDAGSMLALAACRADVADQQPRLICDLCAAPGGKASALLESIGSGFLLANEPIRSRVAPLAFNLARTGNPRYAISSSDPDVLADRLAGQFDLVLVDAPCSGQALLGRGKQSVAALSSRQIEHSAGRARRILSAAVRLLRPGGQLVFSTCTFAEQENESQVRWLLGQPEIVSDPLDRLLAYRSSELDCAWRLWPHLHDCAGGFAASLRVSGATDGRHETSAVTRSTAGRGRRRDPSEAIPDGLAEWYEDPPRRCCVRGAVAWGWPDDAPEWTESVAVAGPEIAYRTGRTWKPSYDAALRRTGNMRAVGSVDVSADQAVLFLGGHPIECGGNGWCVVRHRGRPLGWAKVTRKTGKNHLPAAARMDGVDPLTREATRE